MIKSKFFLSLFFLVFVSYCYGNDKMSVENYTDVGDTIIYSGNATICKGGTKVLEAAYANSGDKIEWLLNKIVINGALSKSYVATVAGRYDVVVTTLGGSNKASNTLELKALELPFADFLSAPNGQCSDIPITFTDLSTSAVSWSWDFGDPTSSNNISAEKNPAHTFVGNSGDGNQSFMVKLTVTNAEGCTQTVQKTIVTKNLPDASLEDEKGGLKPFTNCVGVGNSGNYELTVANISISDNASYEIDWGDGSTIFRGANFTKLNHTYTTQKLFKLRFTVIGKNGCVAVKFYDIFNGSFPAIPYSNPGGKSDCGPYDVVIKLGVNTNTLGTKYIVSFTDGSPKEIYDIAPDSIVHTFKTSSCGFTTPGGSKNAFSIQINAVNQCGESEITIGPFRVSSKPVSVIEADKNSVCLTNTPFISFTNQSKSGALVDESSCSGITKSNWIVSPSAGWSVISGKLGDKDPTSNSNTWGSKNLQLRFSVAGKYTVKLITENGCGQSVTEKEICVTPPPFADFSLDKENGCGPITVKVINKSTLPACGINTYQWLISRVNAMNCPGRPPHFTYINDTNLTSENPEVRFNTPGEYSFTLTTKSADGSGCTATSTIRTVRVQSPPVVEIGAPSVICVGAKTNFGSWVENCYSSAVKNYKWTLVGADIPSSTASDPKGIIYSTPGEYEIKLEASNECGTTIATSKITILSAPQIVPVTNKVLCGGEKPGIITFTNIANSTNVSYAWKRTNEVIGLFPLQGAGNIPSFTATNNTSTVLTSTFTVTPKAGACEGVPITFTISVNPSSPTANAGVDQKLCNQTEAILSANNPGAFLGTWTIVTGSGISFEDANKYNTKVTGLTTNQTYVLKWTIAGVNPCPATSEEVTIFNRPEVTIAKAGDDLEVCDYSIFPAGGNSIVLQANADASRTYETGTWTVVSKPSGNNPIIVNPNLKSSVFRSLIPGEYELKWTITNDGGCGSSSDNVKIKVFAKPNAGSISAPLSVCAGTDVTLKSSGSVGEIVEWQYSDQPNGPWTVIPDSKKTSITDANLIKSRYYQVKVASEGGTCSGVVYGGWLVLVNPSSVSGVTSGAKTTCSGINNGTITLAGQTGTVSAWQKSTNDVDFTDIPFSATQSYNYSGLIETTYFRAVVKSGACSAAFSSSSKITITAAVDVANAGLDINLCNYNGKVVLNANAPVSGAGKWKQISGPVIVFLDVDDPKTTAEITLNGTYVFEWEISNNVCEPSKDVTTVNNYAKLVNKISGTATFCFAQSVDITGEMPSGGSGSYTYQWQKSTDNLVWSVIANESSRNLNFNETETVYVRRLVTSASCKDTSDAVLITILPQVANNSIDSNQEICIGKVIEKLTGTTPSGGNGSFTFFWESSADNVIWKAIPDAFEKDYQPANLLIDTYFKRNIASAECNGAQKSASNVIKITVRPNAIADFVASKTKSCIPFDLKSVITVTPHPDKNSTYQWFANDVNIGSGLNFPGYTITDDGKEVKIKLSVISKFGCEPDEKEIGFSTTKNVKASFTKDKQKDCGPLSVNFVNTSQPLDGATYFWDFGNGQSSAQAKPTSVIFQPHPLGKDTTYYISLTAKTDCSETIISDSVTVRAKPQSIFSPDITIGCSPLEIKFTNQSRGVPNKYTFDFGDGEQLVKFDNATATHTFFTTKTDTLTVKLFAENECGIDSSSYEIVVYPNTIKAELVVDGNKTFGCAPFKVKFYNNTEGASSFKWDFSDGSTATSSQSPGTIEHTFNIPGVYNVKLTGTNGCSTASATEQIVVYRQPSATFDFNKPQYCVGEEVEFNNKSLKDLTFIWDFSDGTTSNDVNPIHKFSQSGTYNVKLTAFETFPDGTTCSAITVNPITVILKPIATFTTNAESLNCAPFTVKVNATPANASGGVEWDFGDTTSPDNISLGYTSSHTYTKPGIYILKSIAYNKTGCADSTQQIIRITEPPVANFQTADTLICGNSKTITFTNNTTYGGAGNLGYKWYVNDAFVTSQKNLTYSFNLASSVVLPYVFSVKLVVQSTIGCPDTLVKKVQFNPLPKANFNLANDIGCVPFLPSIENTSAYADNFRWYLDNVLVSTDTELQNLLLNEPNKTFKIKLVAGNLYGCKLDSVEKQLNTYPQPKSIFTLVDSVSCNGKLDLKTINKSTGAIRYRWNFGDASPESVLANPTHIYGIAGIYKLTLIAYNNFCSDTSITNIKISNVPKAAFKVDNTSGCTKLQVVFENLSDNAISYLWDFGDGSFSTSKNPTHSYTYQNSPFNVKLIAMGEYGCSDTTIKTNFINIATPPKANFDILPDSVIKIPDYTFDFKNKSEGNPVKFLWDFGNGKTSVQENPSITYADTGVYKVRLIVINAEGCADTIVRNAKVSGVPGYLFIPNAFEPGSQKTDLRTFKVKGSGISQYDFKIFNKWGEQIWASDKLNEDGEPLEGWDGFMNGLPAPQGVYIWSGYAKFIDGSEWKGMKYQEGGKRTTGAIHLIR